MSVSAENLAAAVMSAAAAASASDNKENATSRITTSSSSASATAKFKMYDAEKKQIILMRGGQEALTGVFIVRKMRVAMRVDGI